MPREMIGGCGQGESWQLDLGLTYLKDIFAETEGCKICILYTEYEGMDDTIIAYPSIGLDYEGYPPGIENFAARLQNALSEFDRAIDWSKIGPGALAERFEYQLTDSGRVKVLDDVEEEDGLTEDDE